MHGGAQTTRHIHGRLLSAGRSKCRDVAGKTAGVAGEQWGLVIDGSVVPVQHPSSPEPEQGGTEPKPLSTDSA